MVEKDKACKRAARLMVLKSGEILCLFLCFRHKREMPPPPMGKRPRFQLPDAIKKQNAAFDAAHPPMTTETKGSWTDAFKGSNLWYCHGAGDFTLHEGENSARADLMQSAKRLVAEAEKLGIGAKVVIEY